MDTDELNISNNDNDSRKKCFSLISSRRFGSTILPLTCRLCPSMDLMVFGYSHSTSSDKDKDKEIDSQPNNNLWLHRTLTSQKLATLTCNARLAYWRPDGRLLAVVSAEDVDEDVVEGTRQELSLYHVEEMMTTSSSSTTSSQIPSSGLGMSNADTNMASGDYARGKLVSLSVPGTAVGIVWALVGKPHPAWNVQTDTLPWTYQQRYVDRQADFLPQSSTNTHLHHHNAVSSDVLPSCKTPLTLLCVATTSCKEQAAKASASTTSEIASRQLFLNMYLHGRFAILKDLPIQVSLNSINPSDHGDEDVEMVVSTNLTHIAVLQKQQLPLQQGTSSNTSSIHLLYLPQLARDRYHLQTITALGCSIQFNLQKIQIQTSEIAASYKSSIKPLDLKLEALDRILQNYWTDDENDDDNNNLSLYSVLLQYIATGSTNNKNSNTSSIMEAFFTNVQMNDQLLLRMERSLTTAVANVETQLRRLLQPAQMLVSQTAELHALAQTFTVGDNNTNILHVPPARRLHECTFQLLLALQHALTVLIQARFALRDWVAWLRHAGAQIRAHGTSSQSPQAEAAKKKRVSQALVQRVISQLHQAASTAASSASSSTKRTTTTTTASSSITERILGLRFSELLQDEERMLMSLDSNQVFCNIGGNEDKPQPTQKMPPITTRALRALSELLEAPQEYMKESVHCMELQLSSSSSSASSSYERRQQHQPPSCSSIRAMTTRLGKGGVDPRALFFGQGQDDGFFAPREQEESTMNTTTTTTSSSLEYREWLVLAEAGKDLDKKTDVIRLHALPLTWTPGSEEEEEEDDDDDDSDDADEVCCLASNKCYWTTLLSLPDNCTLQDVAFYGDDGKSSLSAGSDSGTGKEQRQALGLLVHRDGSVVELWLVSYDDCVFCRRTLLPLQQQQSSNQQQQQQQQQQQRFSLDSALPDNGSEARIAVRPMPDGYDNEGGEAVVPEGVLYAKTRVIGEVEQDDESNTTNMKGPSSLSLIVSGSRGIGAVLNRQNGGTTVDLLDLEEDEEEEEQGEDMSTD